MNILEKKYLSLKINELSVQDFEKWVYEEEQLEKLISYDDYVELISLDYTSKYSMNKIEDIIYK